MPNHATRSARSSLPAIDRTSVAWINTDQMVEVDRVMIEDLGISLVQMMENAGRNLADLVVARFHPQSVLVLAGGGGNGGGGLVASRHLHNLGVEVTIVLTTTTDRFGPVPTQQLTAAQAMGLRSLEFAEVGPDLTKFDLAIDAMVGYSLQGALRGVPAAVAEALNASAVQVLSLDAPSGVDISGPGISGPNISGMKDPHRAVVADATMTLCLPKVGLDNNVAVGELYLADISVPPEVTASFGPQLPPPFAKGRVLHLR